MARTDEGKEKAVAEQKLRKAILFPLTLILGVIVFYLIGGLQATLVYLFLWTDKTIISFFRVGGDLGIEFISLPVILAGFFYGPWIGFLFGFVAVAVIGDALQWTYARAPEPTWPPGVPSIDTFIAGLTAVAAALLVPYFSFIFLAPLCVVIKNFMTDIRDKVFGIEGIPMSFLAPKFWINLAWNWFFIAWLVGVFPALF